MKLKTGLLTAGGCLGLLFTGCLVISVAPYYNEKDLTFEPSLLENWTKAEDQNEHWKFEKQGNGYRLTVANTQSTNVAQAHLFKLNGVFFLDTYAPDVQCDVEPPAIPSHLLVRVQTLAPNPKLCVLEHGWLRDYLAKEPNALRHEIPVTKEKPEDRAIVLTANTAELQAFILKHLDTKEAWSEPFELKRD